MPFEIVRNDITEMQVDAIVNTTSVEPGIGSGVDAQVHRKAGPKLLEARKKAGRMKPGQAFLTPGFGLEAKHVIHVLAPTWTGEGAARRSSLPLRTEIPWNWRKKAAASRWPFRFFRRETADFRRASPCRLRFVNSALF